MLTMSAQATSRVLLREGYAYIRSYLDPVYDLKRTYRESSIVHMSWERELARSESVTPMWAVNDL